MSETPSFSRPNLPNVENLPPIPKSKLSLLKKSGISKESGAEKFKIEDKRPKVEDKYENDKNELSSDHQNFQIETAQDVRRETSKNMETLERTPVTNKNEGKVADNLDKINKQLTALGVENPTFKIYIEKSGLAGGWTGEESNVSFDVNLNRYEPFIESGSLNSQILYRNMLGRYFGNLGDDEEGIIFGSNPNIPEKLNQAITASLGKPSGGVLSIYTARTFKILAGAGLDIRGLQTRGAFEDSGGANEKWFADFAKLNHEKIMGDNDEKITPANLKFPGDKIDIETA